jgi:hypothetical protein
MFIRFIDILIRLYTEATPHMPKLSLLLMLDGEATDSEPDTFPTRLRDLILLFLSGRI